MKKSPCENADQSKPQGLTAETQRERVLLFYHTRSRNATLISKGAKTMKSITKMSRLTGELEKAFRLLNEHFFGGELPTPVLTVIPTPRAYAHYTQFDAWSVQGDGRREINIGSGTLNRPLEETLGSLLHEMTHEYCDVILHVQDTSNKGVYHNRIFKREAEAHGLNVSRSEKYGWSHTEPGDALLEFVLEHDGELREIELCRTNPPLAISIGGIHTGSGDGLPILPPVKSHHRKYFCPDCGTSVRATKEVHILCADCMELMLEA